jgi:hypothetical protein
MIIPLRLLPIFLAMGVDRIEWVGYNEVCVQWNE